MPRRKPMGRQEYATRLIATVWGIVQAHVSNPVTIAKIRRDCIRVRVLRREGTFVDIHPDGGYALAARGYMVD